MALQDALALNDQVITVTMNGREAAAVTTAIAAFITLTESEPALCALFGEDVTVLSDWIASVTPLIENMAAAQRQAANDAVKEKGYL